MEYNMKLITLILLLSIALASCGGGVSESSSGSSNGGLNTKFSNMLQKLTNDHVTTNSYFGDSAAISGDYAIVGACGESVTIGGTTFSYAGAAYIFHRTSEPNTWDSGTRITALNPSASAYFGYSVSINGDYAIVGAYGESSGAGAAYLFY